MEVNRSMNAGRGRWIDRCQLSRRLAHFLLFRCCGHRTDVLTASAEKECRRNYEERGPVHLMGDKYTFSGLGLILKYYIKLLK